MKSWLYLLFILAPLWCAAQTAGKPGPSAEELSQWIGNARSLRSLIRSDPHRPRYHFVVPEGKGNPFDPNGALYWKGKYHLGFIYQSPLKQGAFSVSGNKITDEHRWGHAVSTDLVHWTLYPDMLVVNEGDQEKGIFSGGAFVSKEGVPHLIYYGLGAQANLLAYATDEDLKVWKKVPTPALRALNSENPMDTKDKYSVFDPDAWYEPRVGSYYQISAGMKPALFKSKDLKEWSYLGDLIDPKKTYREAYEDLSCPDFFSLGEKSMLLFISHTWGSQYYIGRFGNDKFSPEQHGRMNWPGGSFFAPEQLQDDKGRNIIWGWVVQRKPPHLPDYGWSQGVMSLPRVVSLGRDDVLRIEPAKELESLRLKEISQPDMALPPNTERTLEARGTSLELKLEIEGVATAPVGVKVFASADGREETVITYDPLRKQLIVDFEKSSVRGPVKMTSSIIAHFVSDHTSDHTDAYKVKGYPEQVSQQRAPFELKKGEPLQFDIFLDKSVLEIFVNGRQAVTQVVYPELDASNGLKVFSGAEAVRVKSIRAWPMADTNAF